MEFFFAVFFLLFYYIRPQDWVEGLAGANLIKPIVGIWLVVLLASRSRPSPLPGIVRTPHDWIVLIYLGYIVFFGNASIMAVLPLFAFYALTVQSVNSWPRLLKYLKFWNGALAAVSAIAVASIYGLDITGAQDNPFTEMGRLAIGTWLHDNPNSLAHSVVVVIPVSYILFFWRGSSSSRFVVFPILSGIAFYCAWETQSKGAYLVGAATVALVFVIGRPKMVKVFVIALVLLLGVSALSFLPRMSEMGNLRADEGVQGRLLAWEMARTAALNSPTGEGWRSFIAHIPWQEGLQHMIVTKSTHASYVQVAADLGIYGLFLYLAGLWTAGHTLIILKTNDLLQERCRRVLLILLIANVISGWMINRQYHTEYFLLIAATAALHRLKKGEELESVKESLADQEAPEEAVADVPVSEHIWPRPSLSASIGNSSLMRTKPLWNRFGLLDLSLCISFTWLTFWVWDYILKNI